MALLNGVYEPMDLDINIGKDNEIFSPHLRLGRFPLLEKQSEELSYPFRSTQCTLVDGLKSFFVAYIYGSYFVIELELQSMLFCFSVNSKLHV